MTEPQDLPPELAAWFTARADAIRDVAAHRASPPEYPGMALVPVPDLDRLAVYVELPKSRAALPVPALDALNALAAKVRTEREAIAVCPHCDETDERNTARIIVLDWVLQQVAAPDALREALEAIVEMSWDPDPPRRLTALNRINVTARAALREGETP